jgi:hypothetical protein
MADAHLDSQLGTIWDVNDSDPDRSLEHHLLRHERLCNTCWWGGLLVCSSRQLSSSRRTSNTALAGTYSLAHSLALALAHYTWREGFLTSTKVHIDLERCHFGSLPQLSARPTSTESGPQQGALTV